MPRTNRVEKPQRIKKEKFLHLVEDAANESFIRITIQAKTQKQKEYMSAINSKQVTIGIGPPGVGKTWCSAAIAAKMYHEKKIDKIIITRPNVAAGPSFGFLPGSAEEKHQPWARPILDVFNQLLGKGAVESAINHGNIEFVPLESMRGLTFDGAMILLDEAQNLTAKQLFMFVTRIGEKTKLVIDGDLGQIDIRDSGFDHLLNVIDYAKMDIPVIEFTMQDCVRSGIVREFLFAFHDFQPGYFRST